MFHKNRGLGVLVGEIGDNNWVDVKFGVITINVHVPLLMSLKYLANWEQ